MIILTAEKIQVRMLKTISYEVRVSELHAWLAHRMVVILRLRLSPSQQSTRQEDQFEESPLAHDAKSGL